MNVRLQLEMIIAAIALLVFMLALLRRNYVSVKSAIVWLLLPVVFVLIVIFVEPLTMVVRWLGFDMFSNFIFVVIIGLLLLLCFFFTIVLSKQQKQITGLIQELSLLKQKVGKKKDK